MKTTSEDESRRKTARKIFESFLEFAHLNWTDEDLLYHPVPEGREYVAMVNLALQGQFSSFEIMGWLMAGRKKGGAAFKKPRGGVRVDSKLKELGLDLTRLSFHKILSQIFAKFWSPGTVEQLLRNFDQSPKFCDLVRVQVKCPNLPSDLILLTLQNWRKSQRKGKATSL